MHSGHAPEYSAFFTSGFRVVSRLNASSPKPIPPSFDSVSSGLEDSPSEHMNRRKCILNLLLKSKPATADENLSSSSYTSKPSEHRNASPNSNLLGRRQSHETAAADFISNDESGWLSSTSSIGSVDEDIDFMDLSIWPKCPLGFGGHPPTITEIGSRPEILDPFSSLPGSKSFFVDCDFLANASTEEPRPTRRRRPVSLGPWSNRFSSESSIFSLSSSSRRNSLPFQPSSFLSTGTSCRTPSANFSFSQLPRVPMASKGRRERPASIALSPRASVYTTLAQTDHPTKAEKQANFLYSSVAQTLQEESPTQLDSQSPQFPEHSSHTRPLPLIPQSSSISVSSPEDKYYSGPYIAQYIALEAETHDNSCSASSVVPFLASVPVPESQVFDQVDDESVDVFTEREQGSNDRPQTSELGEEAPSSVSDARVFFENQMGDVSNRMDWREFCIEVLDGRLD